MCVEDLTYCNYIQAIFLVILRCAIWFTNTINLPLKLDSRSPLGAEFDLSSIRKTDIIWLYELWFISTTFQNDCGENSYTAMTGFTGFYKIMEAKNDLQNWVLDDFIVVVRSRSLYHQPVSSPTGTYWVKRTKRCNNIPFAIMHRLYVSLDRRRRVFGAQNPTNWCFTCPITDPATINNLG